MGMDVIDVNMSHTPIVLFRRNLQEHPKSYMMTLIYLYSNVGNVNNLGLYYTTLEPIVNPVTSVIVIHATMKSEQVSQHWISILNHSELVSPLLNNNVFSVYQGISDQWMS